MALATRTLLCNIQTIVTTMTMALQGTMPFQSGGAPTPEPNDRDTAMRTTMMNRPPEHGLGTAETSFIEGSTIGMEIFILLKYSLHYKP